MTVNRLPDYLEHMRQAASDAFTFVEGLILIWTPPQLQTKNAQNDVPTEIEIAAIYSVS